MMQIILQAMVAQELMLLTEDYNFRRSVFDHLLCQSPDLGKTVLDQLAR